MSDISCYICKVLFITYCITEALVFRKERSKLKPGMGEHLA